MSSHREAKHLVAVLAVTVLLGFDPAVAQHQSPSPKDDGFIPEWYSYGPDQPSCKLRVDFSFTTQEERREKLLSGIDLAYADTEAWQQDFSIAGVDYVDFRYTHVITYRPCSESEELISRLSQVFGTERGDWTVAEHANLLSTVKELDELGQVGVFVRYRSKTRIQPCLIRIRLTSLEAAIPATDGFLFLQQKYRPPFADITFINRNSYLLLSRQCERKRAIYDQLLFLLKRENRPTDVLGPADFDPSPYEYFSHYRCQLGLPDENGSCRP